MGTVGFGRTWLQEQTGAPPPMPLPAAHPEAHCSEAHMQLYLSLHSSTAPPPLLLTGWLQTHGESGTDLFTSLKLHGEPDTVGDVELRAQQSKGGVQQMGGAAQLHQLQKVGQGRCAWWPSVCGTADACCTHQVKCSLQVWLSGYARPAALQSHTWQVPTGSRP